MHYNEQSRSARTEELLLRKNIFSTLTQLWWGSKEAREMANAIIRYFDGKTVVPHDPKMPADMLSAMTYLEANRILEMAIGDDEKQYWHIVNDEKFPMKRTVPITDVPPEDIYRTLPSRAWRTA